MALNFPSSPTVGQTYRDTTSGFSYQWDGTVWKSYSDALSGIVTYANIAGVSTSVVGGIASISQLNVSGISTLGTLQVLSGIVTATSGIITYYGDGSNLTGIVTSIVAGTNITVSGSTGQVTINSTATGGGAAALDILEVMLFA